MDADDTSGDLNQAVWNVQSGGYGRPRAEDLARIEAILARDPARVHDRDEIEQKSPLHVAANAHRTEVIEILLRHGADPNARNDRGVTPLLDAFEYVDIEEHEPESLLDTVRLLLLAGADPTLPSDYGVTPFSLAAELGAHGCVQMMIDHGGRPDLRAAVTAGRLDLARRYLADDPHAVRKAADPDGLLGKALQFGAYREDVPTEELVSLLLEHGADPNAGGAGPSWGPPLLDAIQYRASAGVVRTLLRYGADVNARAAGDGPAALEAAARGAALDVIQLLLDAGARHLARGDAPDPYAYLGESLLFAVVKRAAARGPHREPTPETDHPAFAERTSGSTPAGSRRSPGCPCWSG